MYSQVRSLSSSLVELVLIDRWNQVESTQSDATLCVQFEELKGIFGGVVNEIV